MVCVWHTKVGVIFNSIPRDDDEDNEESIRRSGSSADQRARVMLELLDIFVQLLRSFSVSRRVLLLLLVSVLVVLLAWVLVVKLLVSILELLLVSVLVMLLAWVLVLLLVSVLALRLLPILVLVPVLVRISDSCTAMLS